MDDIVKGMPSLTTMVRRFTSSHNLSESQQLKTLFRDKLLSLSHQERLNLVTHDWLQNIAKDFRTP